MAVPTAAAASSGAPLAITTQRLDAPSLALAIRDRDVDAVDMILKHGAPLDIIAWGCSSAMESGVPE